MTALRSIAIAYALEALLLLGIGLWAVLAQLAAAAG